MDRGQRSEFGGRHAGMNPGMHGAAASAGTAASAATVAAAKALSSLDWAGMIVVGACLTYSVSLALFRHSVFEDEGIFDSLQDVLSFFLLFLITIRTQTMQETDQQIVYAATAGIALFFAWNTYVKYVAGSANPIRDLTDSTYIVTGANSGIGYETALQLAHMNAKVVLACRTPKKAQEAKEDILRETMAPESNIIIIKLDLCDFDSVNEFVRQFRALKLPLHGLVNNAGVMSDHRIPTVLGMEVTLHSNHLSHFLLTNLLVPELEQTRGRVVTVSSSVHNAAPTINFKDLHFARPGAYSLFPCYGQSKLANILFTKEFARRHSDICSVAVHPGCVRTHITQNMHWLLNLLYEQFEPVLGMYMKSRQQGAYSTLHALLADVACAGNLPTDRVVISGNMYFHGKLFRNTSPACNDKVVAQKLWEVSEDLTDLAKRRAALSECKFSLDADGRDQRAATPAESKNESSTAAASPSPIPAPRRRAINTSASNVTPGIRRSKSPKAATSSSKARAKSPATRSKSPRANTKRS